MSILTNSRITDMKTAMERENIYSYAKDLTDEILDQLPKLHLEALLTMVSDRIISDHATGLPDDAIRSLSKKAVDRVLQVRRHLNHAQDTRGSGQQAGSERP